MTMTKESLIKLASKCSTSINQWGTDETDTSVTFESLLALQQFVQRIEQPLIDRMETIKAATSILALQLSEARDELVRLRPEVEGLQNDIRERHLAEGRLMDQIEQLREALQALYDEQNGPPLIRDAARWEAAMELASKVLEVSK